MRSAAVGGRRATCLGGVRGENEVTPSGPVQEYAGSLLVAGGTTRRSGGLTHAYFYSTRRTGGRSSRPNGDAGPLPGRRQTQGQAHGRVLPGRQTDRDDGAVRRGQRID